MLWDDRYGWLLNFIRGRRKEERDVHVLFFFFSFSGFRFVLSSFFQLVPITRVLNLIMQMRFRDLERERERKM